MTRSIMIEHAHRRKKSPRTRPLKPLIVLFLGLMQLLWIALFYHSIGGVGESIARDLSSYQGSIDGLANTQFTWDLLTFETIAHRTFVYGEYLASIIFQITGALGGTAVGLHTATLTALTLMAVFLQLRRRAIPTFALLVTLACPFLFANLLLGNTRQLWGCIWILIFYAHTPIFEYFSKSKMQIRSYLRISLFFILIIITHLGSLVVFIALLTIDYISSKSTLETKNTVTIWKQAGGIFLVALVGTIVFYILGGAESLWRLQTKFDFYSSSKNLQSYPYLTGGFFYLVILPLSLDVFYSLKKQPSAKILRFAMLCICGLLLISFILPNSHALDRVLTSLFLLAYIRRLAVGPMQIELLTIPARLFIALFYMWTR